MGLKILWLSFHFVCEKEEYEERESKFHKSDYVLWYEAEISSQQHHCVDGIYIFAHSKPQTSFIFHKRATIASTVTSTFTSSYLCSFMLLRNSLLHKTAMINSRKHVEKALWCKVQHVLCGKNRLVAETLLLVVCVCCGCFWGILECIIYPSNFVSVYL